MLYCEGMKKPSIFKAAWAAVFVLTLTIFAGAASAAPWSFGVMGDTQWNNHDAAGSPDTVAVVRQAEGLPEHKGCNRHSHGATSTYSDRRAR